MLVLGDAHAADPTRREALFAAYRASGASHALQAGDLEYYRLPVPTYFVAGNNEDQDVIEALRHGRIESSEVRNARLLDSRTATVEGVRVAGISGNYAPSRYDMPRAALEGERRRHFTHEDVAAAKRIEGRVDVFLAHQAPHGLPVDEEYEVGCRYIDEILEALDPDLCLVGHHHQHAETTFGDTRVVAIEPAWESRYELDPETLELTRFEAPDPAAFDLPDP
jgi:Icc-related predicted phosphoesterase